MNRIVLNTLRLFVLTALLVLAGSVPAAYAQITVDTTTDELDGGAGNGSCSLREAITNANSDSAGQADCAAGTGTDTIILQAGQTYTLSITGADEDLNATGDLDITDAAGLTIRTDATGSTATIDANDIDRVLEKTVGALTLIDLIIEDGRATEPGLVKQGGAGLRSLDGDVTLTRTTVRDNETFITTGEVGGGGIALPYSSSLGTGGSGTLTLDQSTLDGNRSLDDHAGGLYASGSGLTVVITNSTISNNAAEEDFSGGGILFADGVTATILNSTIAGNGFLGNGDGFGGGIGFFDGNETVTIRFSTIAGNDAGSQEGGGINNFGATVTMSTTILADNTAGTSGPDCLGTITSTVGHNVVENVTDCTLSGTTTGNVTSLDPGLGALADNGGLTLTKSITGTSVAFNTVASGTDGCGTSITADQRASGFTRPQGVTCDIGAFEANVATSTLTVTGSGGANGLVTGFGVTCTSTAGTESGDCSQTYADGTSVTMTATASTGTFITFAGAGCTTSPCMFTITSDVTVDAEFDTVPTTGSITIVKDATPADDTSFDFTETITPGAFTLTDPSDDTEVFASVTAGSYDVTESVPAGWTLESIVCTGDTDGGSTVDLGTATVTIDLDAGEDITCTFTNQGRGDITIVKDATPEDDTPFDFTETITPGAFTLTDPSDNTEAFAAVAAGSYDVAETVPAGWTLASIVCTGDTDGGSVVDQPNGTVMIDLDPGEAITCTFSNESDGTTTDEDNDGVSDADDLCPGTSIPEATVPSVRLGTNRWALFDDDFDFDTTAPNGKGPKRSYNTTETGGCSCEQIIEELDLGNGHTKFGCSNSAMDDWVAIVAGSSKRGDDAENAVAEVAETPTAFALESNYPNPFNPQTTITYAVPEAAFVRLVVYDVLGRQVRVLIEGTRAAGTHAVVFDASNLPSGLYLYRLETPQGGFVKTMQLVK